MFDVIVIAHHDGIDLSRWLAVRLDHPDLTPIEQFRETSPFSGDSHTFTTPHSAVVVVDGETIGQLLWADARILCSLEFDDHRDRLILIADTVAAALGATTTIADADELDFAPPRAPS